MTRRSLDKIRQQLIALPIEKKKSKKTFGFHMFIDEGDKSFDVGYGSQVRGFISRIGEDKYTLWDNEHNHIRFTDEGSVDYGITMGLDELMLTIEQQRAIYTKPRSPRSRGCS